MSNWYAYADKKDGTVQVWEGLRPTQAKWRFQWLDRQARRIDSDIVRFGYGPLGDDGYPDSMSSIRVWKHFDQKRRRILSPLF